MASSNKCEGCVFWEGGDGTYRAKCKKLSDEAQTVTTTFDETCGQFFARAPEPAPLIVPDLQSMTRGIYVSEELLKDCCVPFPSIINPNPGPNANGPLTLEAFQDARRYFGAVRQTFVADEYGDLFDIDKYLREKITDEIMREEDRQILGYPAFQTSMGEGWPLGKSPIEPVVFGDFSHYLEPLRITDFSVDFVTEMPQMYWPDNEFVMNWRPRQRPQSRIEGKAQVDPSQLTSLSLDQPLKMKLVNRNGMEIDFSGRITGVSMSQFGTEIEFVGERGATMTYPITSQLTIPTDQDDEEEWDEDEDDDEGWGSEEELLDLEDLEDLEDDLNDEEKEEDEGYGGNRRFYL